MNIKHNIQQNKVPRTIRTVKAECNGDKVVPELN